MQFLPLQGNTGYIELEHALLPVYRLSEKEIILFDTGLEESIELLQLLARENLHVRAILCSHLHPDHTGSNAMLVQHHGSEVFAHKAELTAQYSWFYHTFPVTTIGDESKVSIDGVSIDVVPTPGHSPGHLAYITPDNVCYTGDAIMSHDVLLGSKLPFMEDIDGSLLSMETLRNTDCTYYIAAHKGVIPQAEICRLIDENIQKEIALYDLLRPLLQTRTPVDTAVDRYLALLGVQGERAKTEYIRFSALSRFEALTNAGEYIIEDGFIFPSLL